MKILSKIIVLFVILSMLVSCDAITSLFPEIAQTTTTTSTTTTTTTNKPTDAPKPDKELPKEEEGPTSDPYKGMSKEEFYENYTPATSYMDAYYRTQHYFMSGDLEVPDEAPEQAEYQPMVNDMYVRNTSALYSDDGNVYYVLDSDGNIANRIYRGGAYITLEEVAAYVFAFGDVPPNYTSSKKESPASNPWGEFLRLNHSKFSVNTEKYPYEPELPGAISCGGDFQYYEIDIGTTGTDTGNGYEVRIYNNGYSIVRGAARIVYTRYDKNGDNVIDLDEKYLFYTYNHYNDFQEYLNYEGGWGEIFGNITGGGSISSKYDYNPTPYVRVVKIDLWESDVEFASVTIEYIALAYIHFDKKEDYYFAKCA